MANIDIQNVTGVRIVNSVYGKTDDHRSFETIRIIVETENGEESVTLYSDGDKHGFSLVNVPDGYAFEDLPAMLREQAG